MKCFAFAVPEKNLASLLQDRFYRYGGDPALWTYGEDTWTPLSWQAWGERIRSVGSALIASGLHPGDRIILATGQSPETIFTELAAISIGLVTVSLPTACSETLAQAIVEKTQPSAILAHAVLLTRLPTLKSLRLTVTLDDFSTWESNGSKVPAPSFFERMCSIAADAPASIDIFPTSTGEIKTLPLTHAQILAAARSFAEAIDLRPKDRSLAHLPLQHPVERLAGLWGAIYGGAQIGCPATSPPSSQEISRFEPTVFIWDDETLETFYNGIRTEVRGRSKWIRYLFERAARPRNGAPGSALAERLFFRPIRQQLGGHLRCLVAAMKTPNALVVRFLQNAGIEVLTGLSLPEAPPFITLNRPELNKPDTLGPPLPGIELKISTNGELLVRGSHVYVPPEETERFLRTQISAAFDSEGYVRVRLHLTSNT